MSDYCSCCGSSVPEGQGVCSMCYGDMDYGNDGYYRQWAEEQAKQDEERQEQPYYPLVVVNK